MGHLATRGHLASYHFASNHLHSYTFGGPIIYPDPVAATLEPQLQPLPTGAHTTTTVFPRAAPGPGFEGVVDIAPATFVVGTTPKPSESGAGGVGAVSVEGAGDGGTGDAFVTDIRNAVPKLNIGPHKAQDV